MGYNIIRGYKQATNIMGYRQTVRHWILIPASQGSNPCSPVKK